MPVTVHFATNRLVSGDPTDWHNYGTSIDSPADPQALLYATAFVDDANLKADTNGAVKSIQDVSRGTFSQSAINDLSRPKRNILIFLHGFANTFENALTRAAYNQQWIAKADVHGADTTVIAFSWPSLGEVVSWPILWSDYKTDQGMAGQSGSHLMRFFANLLPLLTAARATGARTTLLAHSMGNFALQAAVESWFANGQGDATLFDEVILAAADERFDSFDFPNAGRLSGLSRLAHRISVYYSHADAVLPLSQFVNLGAQRIGQDGPRERKDSARFPLATYRMVDCTGYHDYPEGFMSSHQYYRSSPGVRADIAAVIGGGVVS